MSDAYKEHYVFFTKCIAFNRANIQTTTIHVAWNSLILFRNFNTFLIDGEIQISD